MKPPKIQSYFVQNLLLVFAGALLCFGILFQQKTIVVTPGTWGFLQDGESKISLMIGTIPLLSLAVFVSFLCTYLLFEFYGLKTAFFATLCLSLTFVVCFSLFDLMKTYSLNLDENFDYILHENFSLNKLTIFSHSLATAISFSLGLIIATLIKKLTHVYFMFVRFPAASIICFAAFVTITVYVQNFQTLAPRSIFYLLVTPFAQFVLLSVISLIPLYLLRFVLGIFRGKTIDSELTETTDKAKSLFKPKQAEPEQNDQNQTQGLPL